MAWRMRLEGRRTWGLAKRVDVLVVFLTTLVVESREAFLVADRTGRTAVEVRHRKACLAAEMREVDVVLVSREHI